jgi:DNA polymerase-3 subunit epsilon
MKYLPRATAWLRGHTKSSIDGSAVRHVFRGSRGDVSAAQTHHPYQAAGLVDHERNRNGRPLTNSGRYRILERLVPRAITDAIRQEYPFRGVILDTETTGLNHRKDEIIEIGAISFTFDDQGKIGDVTGVYCGLQQPTVPIPAEITTLTGITDEMVAGQVIDMSALRVLIDPADLVVAHNASFDRPFCEAFSPAFAGKAWACSTRKSTGQRAGSKAPSLDT